MTTSLRSNVTGEELTEHEKHIEERAEALLEHDVLACQSSLVDDLIKQEGHPTPDSARGYVQDTEPVMGNQFSIELISNLYPDPADWDREKCLAWLDENVNLPDEPRAYDLDELREHVSDNTEPAEIFEWWLVGDRLADELDTLGYCILDNDYGKWWGRTCTGQAIMLDGTLQEVAELIHNRAEKAAGRS